MWGGGVGWGGTFICLATMYEKVRCHFSDGDASNAELRALSFTSLSLFSLTGAE